MEMRHPACSVLTSRPRPARHGRVRARILGGHRARRGRGLSPWLRDDDVRACRDVRGVPGPRYPGTVRVRGASRAVLFLVGGGRQVPCSRTGKTMTSTSTGRASTPRWVVTARRSCCCTATRRPTSCGTASHRGSSTGTRWSSPTSVGTATASRPASTADHASYSKRAMAADQVGLMHELGFDRFAVVGHDRGARVAHRLCLDRPEAVTRAGAARHRARPDTCSPTSTVPWRRRTTTGSSCPGPDLPEHLIGADPDYYLRRKLAQWSGGTRDRGLRARGDRGVRPLFQRPGRRSVPAARTTGPPRSIDLEHDEADAAAGRRVELPAAGALGRRGRSSAVPTTCWTSGAATPPTCAAKRSGVATSSPRRSPAPPSPHSGTS